MLLPAADDLSSQDQFEVPEAGGWDAILNGEDEDDFFDLQIVKHYDSEVRPALRLPPEGVVQKVTHDLGACAGEGRSLVGLHHPRVPPAESGGDVAGAARVPERPRGGAAQPPRRHAAGPEEAHLRQREPGAPGLRPQLPQEDVHAQHHTRLWRHLRGGLQHPRGEHLVSTRTWRSLSGALRLTSLAPGRSRVRGQGHAGPARCRRPQQPIR